MGRSKLNIVGTILYLLANITLIVAAISPVIYTCFINEPNNEALTKPSESSKSNERAMIWLFTCICIALSYTAITGISGTVHAIRILIGKEKGD